MAFDNEKLKQLQREKDETAARLASIEAEYKRQQEQHQRAKVIAQKRQTF